MKRLLLVAVLGALVFGATGCDVSPPAATVNGVAISQSALNSQLSSEIKNAGEVCAALMAAGATTSPLGIGSQSNGSANAVTPAFADNALEALVLQRLEAQSLAKRGLTVTGADVTAASSDYQDQLLTQLQQVQSENEAPAGCPLSTSKSLTSQLPHAFLQRQAATLADQEQFEVAVGHVDVGPGALSAYYRARRSEFTQVCLNVVVADTPANAQTLHDQIAAGASFATADTTAAADEQESPAGGEIAQCQYPAAVPQIFGTTVGASVNALKTGQVSAPLTLDTTSSTGASTQIYLVVEIRARQLVPLATVASSIRQAILTAHVAVVSKILNRLVGQAQVSVDPRYGTWSAKGGVKVPTAPAPAFVLNADANVRPAPLLSTGGLSVVPAGG